MIDNTGELPAIMLLESTVDDQVSMLQSSKLILRLCHKSMLVLCSMLCEVHEDFKLNIALAKKG